MGNIYCLLLWFFVVTSPTVLSLSFIIFLKRWE